MHDATTAIPSPMREVVRSGAESARMAFGAGSRNALPSRIERLTRTANSRDESTPKIELASDRGREE